MNARTLKHWRKPLAIVRTQSPKPFEKYRTEKGVALPFPHTAERKVAGKKVYSRNQTRCWAKLSAFMWYLCVFATFHRRPVLLGMEGKRCSPVDAVPVCVRNISQMTSIVRDGRQKMLTCRRCTQCTPLTTEFVCTWVLLISCLHGNVNCKEFVCMWMWLVSYLLGMWSMHSENLLAWVQYPPRRQGKSQFAQWTFDQVLPRYSHTMWHQLHQTDHAPGYSNDGSSSVLLQQKSLVKNVSTCSQVSLGVVRCCWYSVKGHLTSRSPWTCKSDAGSYTSPSGLAAIYSWSQCKQRPTQKRPGHNSLIAAWQTCSLLWQLVLTAVYDQVQ